MIHDSLKTIYKPDCVYFKCHLSHTSHSATL